MLPPGHHRQFTSGWARAAVFGASDGLITNVSLILGFAGASPGHTVVRLAGLAGLVAGACSMAAGEFISVTSQRELIQHEIELERLSLATNPEAELAELRDSFVNRGLDPEMAATIASALTRDPEMALLAHTREELGVDPTAVGSPWRAASGSFLAFAVGALLPLLPWLVTSAGNPVWWSIGVGGVGAMAVGATVGWFTKRGMVRTGLRQLMIAAAASAVTWAVGHGVGAR